MKIDNNIITAEEGKVLRRITDGLVMGNVIHLGYTYHEYGVKLDIPFMELPEHYEEIDDVSVKEEEY